MAIEIEIALVTRFCLVFVYLYVFIFFRRNYLRSKAAGFVNKFFVGYAFFFLVFFAIQIGISLFELTKYLQAGVADWIEEGFPDPINLADKDNLFFLYSLAKPIFVLGISAIMILIAGQIYPLELTLGWKRNILSKYLIVVSAGVMLIFIPALTWFLYAFCFFMAALIGVVIGLVMNIGVNIKLARESTGELRRRSVAIIFASLLFYMGFIYTLKIKEISLGELFSITGYVMEWDIVFGSVLQVISALLYRQGLRMKG